MKQICALSILIPAILLMSCNSNSSSETASGLSGIQAVPSVPVSTLDTPGNQVPGAAGAGLVPVNNSSNPVSKQPVPTVSGVNPAHGQPGHRCDIAVGAPLNSNPPVAATMPGQAQSVLPTQASPQKTGAGLNPAHGQPGHRCDIAVGAPLNSKPTTPSSAPATVQTAPATAQPPTSPVKTAAGMNPAHGQPGHRCDIAVGASLNSKPTAPPAAPTPSGTAPAQTATPTSAVNPLPVTPLIPASNAATSPSKPGVAGINPAHGQPGHRCDIAVGAPLDSKPTPAKQ